MLYGVMLIVVLIITGGAIAFIGDRLGTKIGKKRMSIFGLRPRHTSIVITIFTGICITTLTLGVMAAVSQNVRTALFGMERLHQNMQETQQRLTTASQELAEAQSEQAATDAALQQSKDEVGRLQSQQDELLAESQRLQEGNRLLQLANDALNERNSGLMADNERLGSQNSLLTSQNATLQAGNQQLNERNNVLAEVNAALGKRTDELRNGLITMREGDIVFRAGEILASGVIRGNQSEAAVRQQMETLMQLASRNISARVGQNTTDQNIWIYKPEYDGAVATIAKSPKDMVVRVTAAGNLIRGEEVRASLELYDNNVIYQANEFILARRYTLQGKQGGEAEQAVMSFLRDVNFAALQRGILADPLNGAVGVMEGAQFYDIVKALTPVRGDVVLSAYARDNTDALGPLRLKIKMEVLANGQ